MKTTILTILTMITMSGCNIGAGTLGGFDPIRFETDKKTLGIALDTLYKVYPQYTIPDKWKDLDSWSDRGYDFLDGQILYFASPPEEMYYVTILAGEETRISIRAVNDGHPRWLLEEDISSTERNRIMERFDVEIVSKLERLTESKGSIVK